MRGLSCRIQHHCQHHMLTQPTIHTHPHSHLLSSLHVTTSHHTTSRHLPSPQITSRHITSHCRGVKLKPEIFPAATDSRYLRAKGAMCGVCVCCSGSNAKYSGVCVCNRGGSVCRCVLFFCAASHTITSAKHLLIAYRSTCIATSILFTSTFGILLIGIPAFGFSPMKNTLIRLHDNDEYLNKKVFLDGIPIFEGIIEALANMPITV